MKTADPEQDRLDWYEKRCAWYQAELQRLLDLLSTTTAPQEFGSKASATRKDAGRVAVSAAIDATSFDPITFPRPAHDWEQDG